MKWARRSPVWEHFKVIDQHNASSLPLWCHISTTIHFNTRCGLVTFRSSLTWHWHFIGTRIGNCNFRKLKLSTGTRYNLQIIFTSSPHFDVKVLVPACWQISSYEVDFFFLFYEVKRNTIEQWLTICNQTRKYYYLVVLKKSCTSISKFKLLFIHILISLFCHPDSSGAA